MSNLLNSSSCCPYHNFLENLKTPEIQNSDTATSSNLAFLPFFTILFILVFFLKPRHFHQIVTFTVDISLILFTAIWMFSIGVPYGILLVWRFMCNIYLYLKFGQLGSLVEPMDAIGTVDCPKSRQIITSLKILRGTCDLRALRIRCLKTVSKKWPNGKFVYPKFYQKLDKIGGFVCWTPAKFEIEHHVRILKNRMGEQEVLEKLSEIVNEEFVHGRAFWEILIVPEYISMKNSPGPRFALIIRIHHAMGDGFSFMKLIMKDVAGEEELIPAKFQNPAKYFTFFDGLKIFAYLSLKSARALYSEMLRKDSNPLHHGKLNGIKCLRWSPPISIQFLRTTKNQMGVGMSSLLLAAVVEALREYIQKTDPDSDFERMVMSAVIPVPAPNHPDNKLCNKFSVVMMRLPLDAASRSWQKRCLEVEAEFRLLAQSPDAPLNIFLMRLAGLMPHWFYKFFLTNTQATLLISNIPGPNRKIKLWGWELEDTGFWLPSLGAAGVSISFLSYDDHLRIGLTTDTGVIPQEDTNQILDSIVRNLEEMGQFENKIFFAFDKSKSSSITSLVNFERKSKYSLN